MKHLRKFKTESDFTEAKERLKFPLDFISYVQNTNKLCRTNIKEIKTSTEYVDLGLPSGLKWATCNVGASRPENYGKIFSWGDIEGCYIKNYKSEKIFTLENAPYYDKEIKNYTKYTETDGKNILDLSDDAAYIHMGKGWRIPTSEDFKELCDNTTVTEVIVNLERCAKFTAPNGNYILLPTTGRINNDGFIAQDENSASYWASDLCTYNAAKRFLLTFLTTPISLDYNGNGSRSFALSIRAVKDDNYSQETETPDIIIDENGIDLGEKFDVIWAKKNYGANNVEDKGNLYTWDEVQNLTFDDGWRLPTKEEIQNLYDNGTFASDKIFDSAVSFKNEKDEILFFPTITKVVYPGDSPNVSYIYNICDYWSSTQYEDDDTQAYCISGTAGYGEKFILWHQLKSEKLGIRLVKDKK